MGRGEAWAVPGKGERTRDALVRAGVDLLVERGWSSLTVRAVAARAQAPPSLVGYHFEDVRRFRHAVVDAALDDLFSSVLDDLWRQPSWPRGIAAVVRTVQEQTALEDAHGGWVAEGDDLVGYAQVDVARQVVAAELVAASRSDTLVREQLRLALQDVRARLVPWLEHTGVPAEHAWGTAVLLVALLDGLLLHQRVDADLPLDRVVAALQQGSDAVPATRR